MASLLTIVDGEEVYSSAVMARGGYTLAYRIRDKAAEDGLTIEFAHSECSVMDNYCKDAGHRLALARLESKDEKFYSSIDVCDVHENSKFLLEQCSGFNYIDVKTEAMDVRKLIVNALIARTFECEFDDICIQKGQRFFINGDVLFGEGPCIEDVVEDLEEFIDKMDELGTLSKEHMAELQSILSTASSVEV
jgi:hypothetical protein